MNPNQIKPKNQTSQMEPAEPTPLSYIALCLCLIIGLVNTFSSCNQLYRLILSLTHSLPTTAGDELVLTFFSSIKAMIIGGIVACVSMSKIWSMRRSTVSSEDLIYKIGHIGVIVSLIPVIVFCITIIIFVCELFF